MISKPTHPLRTLAYGAAMLALGSLPAGCLNRPVGESQPQTTNILVDQLVQTSVDKIDLLFVIDNSISMADKQEILADALPDLVDRFVSPICVDANGTQTGHPNTADEDCPPNSGREFTPIKDIHIGVVTTSLGGYGSPVDCVYNDAKPHTIQTVDMAHLVGSLARGGGAPSPGGFLSWNGTGRDALVNSFTDQVIAAGEFGCGWEASLESWYRFLVEPFPYVAVERQNCPFGNDMGESCIGPTLAGNGNVAVDQTILDQRAAFLRPDSLMAIIMLSDENDCSFRASGQSWRLAQALNEDQTINSAFRGTAACEVDPNDTCCHSCGAPPEDGCATATDAVTGATVGAGCENGRKYPTAADLGMASDDEINLRCFQQKRRFGVDYLYPVERYVNALVYPTICPFADDLDPDADICKVASDATPLVRNNPIFDDLTFEARVAADPEAVRAFPRPAELVFLAGIVGVPWQDLAVTVGGVLPMGNEPLVYRQNRDVPEGRSADDEKIKWEWILGDEVPPNGIPNPQDPLMIESVDPRTGTTPVNNEPLAPPDSNYGENSINGHEWSNLDRADLQYACIFNVDEIIPLADRQCIDEDTDSERRNNNEAVPNCDCTEYNTEDEHNPLCQQPDNSYGYTQHFAKAYPSIRQLQVLRGYGDNSIVASICPKETANKNADDYGYRPAVRAIVDRLKEQLSDKCLPRPLSVVDNVVQCRLVEAKALSGGESAECDASSARTPVQDQIAAVVKERLLATDICTSADTCSTYRLCEIQQLLPPDNDSCLRDATASGNGWCYVDADNDDISAASKEAILGGCPDTEKRKVRFVGDGTPEKGTVTFFACAGETLDEVPDTAAADAM